MPIIFSDRIFILLIILFYSFKWIEIFMLPGWFKSKKISLQSVRISLQNESYPTLEKFKHHETRNTLFISIAIMFSIYQAYLRSKIH